MRRIWFWGVCFFSSLFAEPLSLTIQSPYGILINAETGAILYEKKAHDLAYPASITKIAIALYVLQFHENNLDDLVTAKADALASISPQAKKDSNYRCPPYWLETDGNHIHIKKGEKLKLKDLLYAMLITSANDAANVIAQYCGGTIPHFMEKLNSYLREIGCKNTFFCNPHGFHHPNHLTTAFDMALITKEALKYPIFREAVATLKYTIPKTNFELERPLVQLNLLLRNGIYYYPKAVGVKTGTTTVAGKNLVAAAVDPHRSLIAVVMGSQMKGDRYEDVVHLFEAAFKQPKMRKQILSPGTQQFKIKVPGGKKEVSTYLKEGLYYDFYLSEPLEVKTILQWKIPSPPVMKDQSVGLVRVIAPNGKILEERPLLAAEAVDATLWHQLKNFIKKEKRENQMLVAGGGALLLFFLFFFKRKSSSRTK